jgi:hypothetical protein
MAMIAVVIVVMTLFVAMRMAVCGMIVPRAGVIPGQCVFR